MERGLMMFFHAILIAFILFVLMKFLLKQSQAVAENRSILVGAIVLIYMIVFGHGLPTRMNTNL